MLRNLLWARFLQAAGRMGYETFSCILWKYVWAQKHTFSIICQGIIKQEAKIIFPYVREKEENNNNKGWTIRNLLIVYLKQHILKCLIPLIPRQSPSSYISYYYKFNFRFSSSLVPVMTCFIIAINSRSLTILSWIK